MRTSKLRDPPKPSWDPVELSRVSSDLLPAPVDRSGWPPLSIDPLSRRRSTDASAWVKDGPPDTWRRE